jgi:hypothetical protein
VNKKYLILIAAVLVAVRYLMAGSAPPAAPAPIAGQAKVAPIAPQTVAPNGPIAPVAPIGPMPSVAPTAPVTIAPIANLAHVPPTPPQSLNPNSPYAYTYTYVSNSPNFSNGIPTGYSTNSVYWITNPPYGNPVSGYTNNTIPVIVRRVPPLATNSTSPNQ